MNGSDDDIGEPVRGVADDGGEPKALSREEPRLRTGYVSEVSGLPCQRCTRS